MIKRIATAATTAAVLASVYGCASTPGPQADDGSSASPEERPEATNGRTVEVSDVLGMFADWDIPDSVSDVVNSTSPDAQVLGVPTSAALGNEYTFDEGRGGTLSTVYLTVEVRDSSLSGVSPGETIAVDLPMPGGTTADSLALIDFGSQPWALAVSSEGVFAGGDVTSVRDLDTEPNPDSVGTTATAVFEVAQDDQVTLPVIDEPALESVETTSTADLSEQLGARIDEGS